MLLAGDLEHNLIEVPLVAGPRQPSADDIGELLAKLERPLADRLMADLNAPEREHLLDHPKAQRKAKVQPDRVDDQLRRKAGVGVLGRARHASLTHPAQATRPAANLTMPPRHRRRCLEYATEFYALEGRTVWP